MEEIWKDIEGYEGIYKVSNLGRVMSCERTYLPGRNGTPERLISTTIKSLCKDKKGYLRVLLSKNGVNCTKKVHRLVGGAFIENPNNLPQINHINGIKDDNRVENLEWADNSINQIHAFALGLNKSKKGENHSMSKLKETDVIGIRKKYKSGEYNGVELSKMYGVRPSNIYDIINRKIWVHVN